MKKRLLAIVIVLLFSLASVLTVYPTSGSVAYAKKSSRRSVSKRVRSNRAGSKTVRSTSKARHASSRPTKTRSKSRSKRRKGRRTVAPTPPPVVVQPVIYTPPSDRVQALRNKLIAGDKSKIVIAVDAGHGGSDSGACTYDDSGTVIQKESDVNLSVVLKLQQLLQAAGYTVVMTRTTDVKVGLTDRANIANNANADIFVSVHHNSCLTTDTASGSEVLDYGSQSGIQFAQAIQSELVKSLWSGDPNKDRGTEVRTDLTVLNETLMTAALSEAGFMNNRKVDAALLATDSFRQQEAQGIFNGIVSYFNQVLNNKST